MQQDELWAMFMHAALQGYSATESDTYHLGHRSEVANHAAATADYALNEFNKRWRKDADKPKGK